MENNADQGLLQVWCESDTPAATEMWCLRAGVHLFLLLSSSFGLLTTLLVLTICVKHTTSNSEHRISLKGWIKYLSYIMVLTTWLYVSNSLRSKHKILLHKLISSSIHLISPLNPALRVPVLPIVCHLWQQHVEPGQVFRVLYSANTETRTTAQNDWEMEAVWNRVQYKEAAGAGGSGWRGDFIFSLDYCWVNFICRSGKFCTFSVVFICDLIPFLIKFDLIRIWFHVVLHFFFCWPEQPEYIWAFFVFGRQVRLSFVAFPFHCPLWMGSTFPCFFGTSFFDK